MRTTRSCATGACSAATRSTTRARTSAARRPRLWRTTAKPRSRNDGQEPARHHHPTSGVGKVVRGVRRERLHVPRSARRQQDRDQARSRVDLRSERHQRQHDQPQGQAEAQSSHRHVRIARREQARRCVARRRRPHRDLRELTTMPVRKRKPTSPGRRFQTVADFSEISRDRPEKSLTKPKPRTGGRNAYGRMTSRHRGGGHKRKYRVIDFRRDKDGVPAKVASIEYDPNRNARIALLHYLDGEKRYILAPTGLEVGDLLQSGQGSEIRPGNALPLR